MKLVSGFVCFFVHLHTITEVSMKKATFLYISIAILSILAGCTGGGMPQQLRAVNDIINQQPDSALVLLDSMKAEKEHWSEDARMRYDLLRLKALNKTYVDFTSDSLPRVLVDYYKTHGTDNDRMLAHYMLGRAYHSMGDAPMALKTYFDAIDQTDTLSADCDFDALMGIYGQMSDIYHKQNLPYDELRALRQHIAYTERVGSEEAVIVARGQLVRPYFLLGLKDSILKLQEQTYQAFLKHGDKKAAAASISTSIYIYTERGQLDKARQLTDIYEKESGLFDEQGNIVTGRESYYYCKGFLELALHQIDSAEYYYRKAIRYGWRYEGYKGLLRVYQKRQNLDSIVHYSILFDKAQDSILEKRRTEAIHQMSALYDYNRSQRVAEQEAEKARTARAWTWGIIILSLLVLAFIMYCYRRSQARKKQEIQRLGAALSSAKTERRAIQDELSRLKAKDYEGLIAEKEQREQELQQMIASLQQNSQQPSDRLTDFTSSQIAQLFQKKSEQKTERPIPSEAEWRLLESQFCQDMPATYEHFYSGKKLSPLELRTCILLILGYPESTIVKMTEKSPQTITTAKARANDKLFGLREASSLKSNLMRM